MNLSDTLTRIKLKLGLGSIASPFVDVDEDIIWIIQHVTIPVFSTYEPYREKMRIHTHDLELVEKTAEYQCYLLPEWKTRKLLYVTSLEYDSGSLAGIGAYGAIPYVNQNITGEIMIANAGMNLMNTMIPKITLHFEKPRKLYIYKAYSYSELIVGLGFEHDKSMASISDSLWESFFTLALLDVKENLYPTMKQFSEVNTPLGTINFKIDDWQDAEQQRRELLKEWDDVYHIDSQSIWYG